MKTLGRILCWLGFHKARSTYMDDGNGNEGGATICMRCRYCRSHDDFYC